MHADENPTMSWTSENRKVAVASWAKMTRRHANDHGEKDCGLIVATWYRGFFVLVSRGI